MRTSSISTAALATVLGGMMIATGFARDGWKDDEEARRFHEQQRELRRAHMEQQNRENQAKREALKGEEPQAICAALKAHFTTQHRENVAFGKEQYGRLVSFVKEHLAAKDAPQERIDAILERIDEHHAEMTTPK
jgi:hypothetical protein